MDRLLGLKENVIIGKLIPAATGLKHYRTLEIEPTEPVAAADARTRSACSTRSSSRPSWGSRARASRASARRSPADFGDDFGADFDLAEGGDGRAPAAVRRSATTSKTARRKRRAGGSGRALRPAHPVLRPSAHRGAARRARRSCPHAAAVSMISVGAERCARPRRGSDSSTLSSIQASGRSSPAWLGDRVDLPVGGAGRDAPVEGQARQLARAGRAGGGGSRWRSPPSPWPRPARSGRRAAAGRAPQLGGYVVHDAVDRVQAGPAGSRRTAHRRVPARSPRGSRTG